MEGLDILHQGLILAVQEYPLPFVRRTVLEFVSPSDEGKALRGGEWVAWWEGVVGLYAGFGLRILYLDHNAIEGLTRWVVVSHIGIQHDVFLMIAFHCRIPTLSVVAHKT